MTGHRETAERLTSLLDLDIPPIGLAFADGPPEGVARATEAVPSACAFWRAAEQGVFFATAEQHHNCPVGAMVMGFDLPEAVGDELGGLVQTMCDQGYLSPDEAAEIPAVERASRGIVYGPLSEMPAAPDLVVMWPSAAQAMLVNEAGSAASWASRPARVGIRPACAALPLALSEGRATLSFGCIGMRTFTGIPDDRMLAAVPGEGLTAFVAALERTGSINVAMREFYEGKAAALA